MGMDVGGPSFRWDPGALSREREVRPNKVAYADPFDTRAEALNRVQELRKDFDDTAYLVLPDEDGTWSIYEAGQEYSVYTNVDGDEIEDVQNLPLGSVLVDAEGRMFTVEAEKRKPTLRDRLSGYGMSDRGRARGGQATGKKILVALKAQDGKLIQDPDRDAAFDIDPKDQQKYLSPGSSVPNYGFSPTRGGGIGLRRK